MQMLILNRSYRLYNKGHTVIGIEGVEKAIVDFFTENNLAFTKSVTEAGNLFQVGSQRHKGRVAYMPCMTSFSVDI